MTWTASLTVQSPRRSEVFAARPPRRRNSGRRVRGLNFALAILISMATSPRAGHAGDAAIAADANGLVTFVTPSMNIECTYVPAGGTPVYQPPLGGAELSCDRAEPSYVRLLIASRGPAVLMRDPGEQPCCGIEPKLNYGQSLRLGPFTCRSEQTGLSCLRDDGGGFSISRVDVRILP